MRALLKPNFFVLDPNSPANTDHTNYETQIREVDPIGSVFKFRFWKITFWISQKQTLFFQQTF